MTTVRPLPQPSVLSQEFWDAAADHRLVRPYCDRCQQSFFPPQVCCPLCLESDWRWLESSGRGTLYSFTVVSRAPSDAFTVPYVIGVVDLDEGFSMMTNIVGIRPENVSIAMDVAVCWEAVEDMVFPVFSPVVVEGQSR